MPKSPLELIAIATQRLATNTRRLGPGFLGGRTEVASPVTPGRPGLIVPGRPDPFNLVWADYVPVWTAEVSNPSLGNGTLEGAFARVGNTCYMRVYLRGGTTTAYGSGSWHFSLPPGVTSRNGVSQLMPATAFDAGSTAYRGLAHVGYQVGDYTTLKALCNDSPAAVSATVPFTWTNLDEFWTSGFFETD